MLQSRVDNQSINQHQCFLPLVKKSTCSVNFELHKLNTQFIFVSNATWLRLNLQVHGLTYSSSFKPSNIKKGKLE